MGDPFNGVVTARDVYGAVQEMRGEMRTTAGEMRQVRADIAELRETGDEHEQRIRSLEQWRARWPLASLGALVGGLAALVAAVLQYLG
ncbi:hypothetical protein [Nocardiopsis suaedae]|uniref:DUF3618 domain-containing protein n=1 Tax=Nocardiopsis suaedae TaxID=3018444 RepID=A0ABT4TLZ9_9ACTN|nr:hypothetical protein [Nocardiopsis suaedae]MDA2805695.1 hypothetical protein [Nocardiopsis suaedae]